MQNIAATSLALLATLASADKCKYPAPSANFTRKGYDGVWYEIAKF